MIHITIPLEPRTKKNSQNIYINNKTGSRFISTSKAYKEYVQDCILLMRQPDSELVFPITAPVNIKAMFYMSKRRKVDLVNLLECLDDVLVNFGVLEDDNCTIVVSHDGSRVMLSPEDPRTEIYIEKVEEDDNMKKKEARKNSNRGGKRQ